MSRFEQVEQEVLSDSYLKEWYENVQKALYNYRPAIPTVDDIIGTVACQMLKRGGEADPPIDEDRAFFAKILWVILIQTNGEGSVDKYYPQIEESLKKELHKKQVKSIIGAQK